MIARICSRAACIGILFLVSGNLTPIPAATPRFAVSFESSVRQTPFTGRVYLFFSRGGRDPRFGPDWFRPEQFVARDVSNLEPGQTVMFDPAQSDGLFSYPNDFSQFRFENGKVQAVARFNPFDRNIGTGEGNGFSPAATYDSVRRESDRLDSNRDDTSALSLTINRLVTARPFRETESVRLIEVPSPLISEFQQRPVSLRAAVVLPGSYHTEPDREYPTIFIVPGFGGTHFDYPHLFPTVPVPESANDNVEFIRVVLDPSCPMGHHVFADSANNGPWGQALVSEFIPGFEQVFRAVSSAQGRFLNGHSSGGWSTLWLQITHPETFGGTWSTAPDPVDFRDWQQVNLYGNENLFVDPDGQRRPLSRPFHGVTLWYDAFSKMEDVLGYGGQLQSFEAVFSPRGADGRPLRLWDRASGRIDPSVAESWRDYDIGIRLSAMRDTFDPRLKGRIHVFMGDKDTFYLDGATRLLAKTLDRPESEAVVEMFPGCDHFTLLTEQLNQRIRDEMAAAWQRSADNSPRKSRTH